MGVQVEELTPRAEVVKPPRVGYIRELKEELRRVTWTTKEELSFSTKVVVGATFLFGIGIYLADLLVKGVLDGFAGIVHLIFG